MAPSPLHGLNIVQTESPEQYADNGQDPLLGNAHFPDLAAQLDLWSNLTFQTDEPLSARKPSSADDDQTGSVDDDKEDDVAEVEGPAPLDAHVNAVEPTPVSNTSSQPSNHQVQQGIPQQQQQQPNYDMGSFLAGFGIDPFLIPQLAPQPPPPQAATLAQLLASYPFANTAPFVPQAHASAIAPAALSIPGSQQQQQLAPAPASSTNETTTQTKRASRSRKAASPTSTNGEESESAGTQALSAAEDKRRRNTAASARFRLKKKEREAALERRAQELENRVNALERECEALRRENGWLKGLVVGVTGASQGASVVPSPGPSQGKRKRGTEESSNVKEEKETKKVVVTA